jgi:hypothetical protein
MYWAQGAVNLASIQDGKYVMDSFCVNVMKLMHTSQFAIQLDRKTFG